MSVYKKVDGEWVQISTAESGEITDLTGTTWYVPSGWSTTAGYGLFNIKYSVSSSAKSISLGSLTMLSIGYYGTTSSQPGSGIITISPYPRYGYMWYADGDFTFTFTGGTDVTNADLIAWLYAYGELQ